MKTSSRIAVAPRRPRGAFCVTLEKLTSVVPREISAFGSQKIDADQSITSGHIILNLSCAGKGARRSCYTQSMFQVSRSCGTPPGAYTPGSGLQHHNHHIALQSAYNSFPTRFSRNRGIQLTSNAFFTQTRHPAHFQHILYAKAASSSLPTHFACKSGIQLTSNAFCTQTRHPAHFQLILHAKVTSS